MLWSDIIFLNSETVYNDMLLSTAFTKNIYFWAESSRWTIFSFLFLPMSKMPCFLCGEKQQNNPKNPQTNQKTTHTHTHTHTHNPPQNPPKNNNNNKQTNKKSWYALFFFLLGKTIKTNPHNLNNEISPFCRIKQWAISSNHKFTVEITW